MGTNSSISFIMPNLLIGLCKGSRILTPYSTTFHGQLGYDLFRLELSFTLSIDRNICPDAIVISSRLGNTLLFEWTEASDPTLKNDQLSRYAKVKTSDLVNFAAVPTTAAQTHDIVLTLRPIAVTNFLSLLVQNGRSFPILALDQQDHCISLHKSANSFKAKPTDEFFSNGIQSRRLPRYLPFSLEACEPKEMVPSVIQNIVSLLIKGETSISLPDFCRGFIPAWEFIGIEKQNELSQIAKGLINDLIQKRWGSQLAKRTGASTPTWKLSPDLFIKNTKSLRKYLNEFIAEVQGDTYQYGLDLDPRS